MARSKRPRLSRQGALTYTIRYCDPGTVKLNGDECHGLTDHDLMRISIEDKAPPDREASVLIHELVHQLVHHGVPMPDDLEEALATFLGPTLFAHIRDNPDFWKHITRLAWPRKPRPRKPPCPSSQKSTPTGSSPSSPSSAQP